MKWKLDVLYDKNISQRIKDKDKFYKVIVRPTLSHGAEYCWLVKNSHVQEYKGGEDA